MCLTAGDSRIEQREHVRAVTGVELARNHGRRSRNMLDVNGTGAMHWHVGCMVGRVKDFGGRPKHRGAGAQYLNIAQYDDSCVYGLVGQRNA